MSVAWSLRQWGQLRIQCLRLHICFEHLYSPLKAPRLYATIRLRSKYFNRMTNLFKMNLNQIGWMLKNCVFHVDRHVKQTIKIVIISNYESHLLFIHFGMLFFNEEKLITKSRTIYVFNLPLP